MAKSLPISATICYLYPSTGAVRNTLVRGMSLCASAANSVAEFFDGAIDSPVTYQQIDGGSSYAVGDLVTLVAGENGSSSARAVFRVTQIDDHSPSSSISSSPSLSQSSSVSSSTSPSSSASPSSSISLSPSHSASPSTSISSSPSTSLSPSTSISSSRSASVSPSTSISNSPSTSISSSPSTSISPSVGAGRITAIELITAGGGYTAGNTYNITSTNGSGTGGSIKILTVSDTGTSIGKLACVANESASPLVPECGILTTNGISVRLSGTSAKAHLLYE